MARKLTEERAAEHGITAAAGHNNGFASQDDIRIAAHEQLQWNQKRQALNDQIKTFRKGLKVRGITLGKLDEKVRQLEWTPEEQKRDHEESAWYAEALRFPVGTQLEFFGTEATPEPVREQLKWKNIGVKDGIPGRGWANEAPDGCPPNCIQSYGQGHEEGAEITRRAFAERMRAAQPIAQDPVEADGGEIEEKAAA